MGYNQAMKLSSRQIILIIFVIAALFIAVLSAHGAPKHKTKKGQMQPDPQRIAEIQAALTVHGFAPGTTWAETKEVCRKIADDHGWQNMYAPDTRVLILIGLLPNLDQDVAKLPGNQIDKDERKWVEQNGVPKSER
jgi:hypothetical protein